MINNTDDGDDHWNDSSIDDWRDTIRVAWVIDIDHTNIRTFDAPAARSHLRRLTDQLNQAGWTVQPVRVDLNGYPYLHQA